MLEEERYKEAKYKDFQKYFELTGHKVEYTGINYIVINDDKVVTSGKTDEEIYSYIIGFLSATEISNKRIQELEESLKLTTETNERNIKLYESIIGEAGGETIPEHQSYETEIDGSIEELNS